MQTENFGPQDKMIPCPCCGEGELSAGMHVVLEDIKRHFGGAPVLINSGARCWAHHAFLYAEMAQVPPAHSDHLVDDFLISNGADIVVVGHTPKEVYDYLDSCAYNDIIAIGLYVSKGFVHVGLRGHKAKW